MISTVPNIFKISRVAKNNVLHGPSVLLGMRPLLPRAWEYCIEDPILDNPPTEGGVGFVGIYQVSTKRLWDFLMYTTQLWSL